jgi:hypothetical protein
MLFLTSYLPFDEGSSCPGVSEIDGGTMKGVFIDTDSLDIAVLFSTRGNVVDNVKYNDLEVSQHSLLNVLADMDVSLEPPTYTVEDRNTTTEEDTTFTVTSSDEGVVGFRVHGSGTHEIKVSKP